MNKIKVGFGVHDSRGVLRENVSRSTMTKEQVKALLVDNDPKLKQLTNTAFALFCKNEEQDRVIARLRQQVDQLQKERRAFYG